MSNELEFSDNAVNLLEDRYLKKNENGEVIETPKGMFKRVAKNIAGAEKNVRKEVEWERKFYQMMTKFEFLPNSPTLMNAGTDIQQLAACFVHPIEDSMEGVFTAIKNAALIHKSGGGTGFAFSRLRPKDDVVKSTGGVSSGPISFLKVFNSATNTVKQGGRRRGANMGVLRVDHPDIINFIQCKGELNEENQELFEEYRKSLEMNEDILYSEAEKLLDDYKRKLLDNQFSNFNLSIGITKEFMNAVEKGLTGQDSSYKLINPRTEEAVDDLDALKVFYMICEYAHKNGEPGVIFLDKVNEGHPINKPIEATNPCGDVRLM